MSDQAMTTIEATALPQGVVTFLFTDIEGSTRLLARHAAAMPGVLARHHGLLAEAIDRHGGSVFETVGDAVYGAFSAPGAALQAAVEVQGRLASEDWGEVGELRVRMAVHSGAVEVRGRHYFGAALFECSRLQSLAHGGQTLCSDTTAELARPTLPQTITLRPLGRHRLKDLDEALDVVQVESTGLPATFPPLRASESAHTNLPHATTSFVGRTDELGRIDELVTNQRLVTLLGPGGTGKTRLALEVARGRLHQYPDGVWLVELAPVASPALVISELADTWGLRAGEGRSLAEVVRQYLVLRRMLLVVDNCEHVREAAATVIGEALRAAAGVSVLATSRESLGLPGEVEFRVPALPPPDDGSISDNDAMRLFLDRARAVRPGLEPTPGELEAIARICRRVEGMPLALELAAARTRSLSLSDLADRLEAGFSTLGSGPKAAQPRQRSLTATLDWSYDLLDASEQALFARLSVFAGSFDLGAAEAIAGDDDVADVASLLESLVDKSLVLVVPGPSTRYRLLEPVKQYAAERLATSGQALPMQTAHAAYYSAFVAKASPYTRGPEQMAWERRLDLEYDNVRLAMAHLLETDEIERYLTVGFDLFVYWMHLALQVEGMSTLLAGLDRADDDVDPVVRLKAYFVVGSLGAEITDAKAIVHARRGLELARSTGDANLIGRMEWVLGATIGHATSDPEYEDHLLEAERLLEAHPEPYWWEPEWERGLLALNLSSYLPPEHELAPVRVRRAITTFEEIGDRAMLAAALDNSTQLWGQADEDWLIGNNQRAADILSEMQVPYWYGHVLMSLGAAQGQQGDLASASENLAHGARLLEEMGDLNCWAVCIRRQALAESARGQVRRAMSGLASVLAAMPQLPMPEFHQPMCLDAAAEMLIEDGQLERAAYALGAAKTMKVQKLHPAFRREPGHEAMQATLESRLGVKATEAHMRRGAETEATAAIRALEGWLADS
ncbi:MAG: adenylate/guanylate cyclase domain-containing protein [Candidatus Limnocylindrales bacterium]